MQIGYAAGAPAILQSLLGHNFGRDFLQLTHGLNVGRPDIRDATMVLVMDQVARGINRICANSIIRAVQHHISVAGIRHPGQPGRRSRGCWTATRSTTA